MAIRIDDIHIYKNPNSDRTFIDNILVCYENISTIDSSRPNNLHIYKLKLD